MYQSFEGIVKNGKIRPTEKIKLKEASRVLITIVAQDDTSNTNWTKLKSWISIQRKSKQVTSYSSVEASIQHLRQLTRS